MPVLSYGQSNFGINLPVGRYVARFLGTEARQPIQGGQYGNDGEPRMAFIFEVTEGPSAGERIIQETGTAPSPKSECARMLLGLVGRELQVREQVDTDHYLNRLYTVKVAVNPKSDKGRLHVGDLEPAVNGMGRLAGSAPTADGRIPPQGGSSTAPVKPPPPPRRAPAQVPGAAPARAPDRFYVDHESVAFDAAMSADEVNALIQQHGCKAAGLPVLREGDAEWRTAAHYGYGDGPIPY